MTDLSFLEKVTKGDKTKMKRYITMYLDMAPKIFDQMRENIETKDWAALAINAHSLKPQADYMGLVDLKEALIQIEDSVKNKTTADIPSIYERAYRIHKEGKLSLSSANASL